MSYVVDRIDRMEGRIADSLNQLQQTLDAVADALLDEDGPAYDEAVAEFDALLRAPEHT